MVLGLGNLLHRDDGLGVHALHELGQRHRFPSEVELVEGGIGGLALLPLLQEAGALVVLDAVRGGGAPGDLYRIPLGELSAAGEGEGGDATLSFSLHGLGLADLLRHAGAWGQLPRGFLLGLEPAELAGWSLELSPPVAARLGRLVEEAVAVLAAWGHAIRPAGGSSE